MQSDVITLICCELKVTNNVVTSDSLIRTVKACVLPFNNGIREDTREVADFYQEPTTQMDLDIGD